MLSSPLIKSADLNALNVTINIYKPVITRNITDDYVKKILERIA
jgi:hypothetical protein